MELVRMARGPPEWMSGSHGTRSPPAGRGMIYHFLCIISFVPFVRGARTPRLAHSALPRA
jgi:hypothetical protein